MSLALLVPLLLQAAPVIFQMGGDAIKAYKGLVAALKLKAGSPEEKLALDLIETHMRWLDAQVADAPLPR